MPQMWQHWCAVSKLSSSKIAAVNDQCLNHSLAALHVLGDPAESDTVTNDWAAGGGWSFTD